MAQTQAKCMNTKNGKERDLVKRKKMAWKEEEREDATLSREAQGQQEALAENKGEQRCSTGDVMIATSNGQNV